MEAHELAKEIHNNSEKSNDLETLRYLGDIEVQRYLGDLVALRYLGDLVDQVAQESELNPEFFLDRYEQNESGYVHLKKSQEIYSKQSLGFYDNQCVDMSEVIVHYFDSIKKNDYTLGYVSRNPFEETLGLAGWYENGCCDGGLGKQIYPGDEEWGAIVGSVDRAIQISLKKSHSNDEIDI